jgi:DNA-binding transcriptional LysR family regulator
MLTQQLFWTIHCPDGVNKVKIAGNLECNNGEVLRDLAIAGLGIALKATWDIDEAISAGQLTVVLPNYPVFSDTSIWAVYPSRHNVPAKVPAFVKFLKENLL